MTAVTGRPADVNLDLAFRATFMPGANRVQVTDLGFQPGRFLCLLQTGDARSIGLLLGTLRVRPAGGVTDHATDRAKSAGSGRCVQERIWFSFSHRDGSGGTKGKLCCAASSRAATGSIIPCRRTEFDGASLAGEHCHMVWKRPNLYDSLIALREG